MLRTCADAQASLVTVLQCRAAGLSDDTMRWRVTSRRWSRLHNGIFLTEPGRSDFGVQQWAALLRADPLLAFLPLGRSHEPQAALAGQSAAHVWGLIDQPPKILELTVPAARRVHDWAGVRTLRRRDFARVLAPNSPPRTKLAATILDCAALGDGDYALSWIARAVQRRRVTTGQLDDELQSRSRHRHRALLRECLSPVAAGAESPAEVRYIRDVEQAHRLPTGDRQVQSGSGRHDNGYLAFGLLVEVDGRLGHEDWEARVRDGRRDRSAAAAIGMHTTRVFWSDVAITPCATAADIAALLRLGGWSGQPRPCRSPECAVVGRRPAKP